MGTMNTMIADTQEDTRTPEELAYEAALDSAIREAREQDAWSRFGTIGYEEYAAWVLGEKAS